VTYSRFQDRREFQSLNIGLEADGDVDVTVLMSFVCVDPCTASRDFVATYLSILAER
jgi:hypothetical protein